MADSWLRDGLLWALVLYVVTTVALAPWGEIGAPAGFGGDPHPLEPADGYQHHNTTVRFTWSQLAVDYELQVTNSTGVVVASQNLTDESSYQTQRLMPDDYIWVASYLPVDDAPAEAIATGAFSLEISAKQLLEWDAVDVSYDFRLLPAPGADPVRELAGTPVHKADVEGLDEGVRRNRRPAATACRRPGASPLRQRSGRPRFCRDSVIRAARPACWPRE